MMRPEKCPDFKQQPEQSSENGFGLCRESVVLQSCIRGIVFLLPDVLPLLVMKEAVLSLLQFVPTRFVPANRQFGWHLHVGFVT